MSNKFVPNSGRTEVKIKLKGLLGWIYKHMRRLMNF